MNPPPQSGFSFRNKLSIWLATIFVAWPAFLTEDRVARSWMLTQRFGMRHWCLAGLQLWALNLPTWQAGEFAVAIFQKGKNPSKERLFLHFNYQDK